MLKGSSSSICSRRKEAGSFVMSVARCPSLHAFTNWISGNSAGIKLQDKERLGEAWQSGRVTGLINLSLFSFYLFFSLFLCLPVCLLTCPPVSWIFIRLSFFFILSFSLPLHRSLRFPLFLYVRPSKSKLSEKDKEPRKRNRDRETTVRRLVVSTRKRRWINLSSLWLDSWLYLATISRR